MSGFLLDTNVVSELMRPRPDVEVLAWFEAEAQGSFFINTITQAEIFLGIALLPTGKRRAALAASAEEMFQIEFANRCLPFVHQTAREYALLVAARIKIGKPISTEDAQIAATAIHHRLQLVTRNTKYFGHIEGLELINPWL